MEGSMEKDHLEILLEDIRGKFDLVLEGHDTLHKEIQDTRGKLCEKINLVDFKVETLNQKIDGVRDDLNQKIDGVRDELGQKIDAVAADLAAHRADTEGHRTGYQVSETRD
jgi:archaellum component FlaC